MDTPTDSGQGQDEPSEESLDLTPSSKGRQRKRNSKYLDYKTEDSLCAPQKSPTKSAGRRGRSATKKSPTKSEKAENIEQKTADGDDGITEKTPQDLDGHISEETPKKKVGRPRKASTRETPGKKTPGRKTPGRKTPGRKTPGRKTPGRKTPGRKSPTTDGGLPTGDGGVADPTQQENGTPKRKYVRKRPAQEVEPAAEPPLKEAQEEPQVVPEEELQPGGRRRRSAAKVALKYLHALAKEVFGHPDDESGAQSEADRVTNHTKPDPDTPRRGRGRKGQKKKRGGVSSDSGEDEDFVPDAEEEDAEELEDIDDTGEVDLEFRTGRRSPAGFPTNRTSTGPNFKCSNGLHSNIVKPAWDATPINRKFRQEHYSSWVFPEWLPLISDWHAVPNSELENYLPQELQSAAFKVSRTDLHQDEPLQRLGRFAAVPAHPDRWDMLLFAGGPVWAMEWCPTPDGSPASQYIALACHRGMDEQHYVNETYSGPGLVQLWDVGRLECDSRPDSQPALAYGLALDKGFIWQLKWCPSGGWEPPSSDRQPPFLPRLGLLAVATSNSVVTIYSLPHPDALHTNQKQADGAGQSPPVYKAAAVVTLKLGSLEAPHHEKSGQVLSMDWLPQKPHNIMAIGFYDGVVGLWDLTTTSSLLQVREPDGTLSLLPYRCLLAHDHAVRALAFCPASRYLLVTAGEDRYVKMWDLRRLCSPVSVLKRFLTNEVFWPLNASGVMMAQDNAYAAIGSHGLHYFDLSLRSHFAVPRIGTTWSISYTDWLNSVVTADSFGDLIFAVLPHISYGPQYVKRTLERRFPVYLTSLVPYDTTKEEGTVGGVMEEEEGGAVEEQEGGETEASDAPPEGGNGNQTGSHGGRTRKDPFRPLRFQTYKEAASKYYLHHTDNNMETFAGSEKRAVWKRMKNTEGKAKMNVDELPLAAIHKVRFNPNVCCYTWLVSGGRTGLVRLNCLKSMISAPSKNMMGESRADVDPEQDVQTVSEDL